MLNRKSILVSALFAMTAAQATTPSLTNKLVQASNDFGLEVLKKQFTEKGTSTNLNFSPLSLNQALSLVTLGSGSHTDTLMKNTLGVGGLTSSMAEGLMNQRLALLKAEDKKNGYVFETANALFARDTSPLLPSYLKSASSTLNATAKSLDFLAPESAGVINKWASDKTRGKITQVIDASTLKDLESLLANATYFKAKWDVPFKTREDMTLPFTDLNGAVSDVHSMTKRTDIPVVTRAGLEAFRLDYLGGAASFYVIVPKDLPKYVDQLTNDRLEDLIQDVDATDLKEVKVTMPTFKFKNSLGLNETLKQLGLSELFTSQADLSKMSKGGLQIGFVKQDTFIAVNNEGTEAAAVTTIGAIKTSVPFRVQDVIVDSPFIYVIRDNRTGDNLFIGTVINPIRE